MAKHCVALNFFLNDTIEHWAWEQETVIYCKSIYIYFSQVENVP